MSHGERDDGQRDGPMDDPWEGMTYQEYQEQREEQVQAASEAFRKWYGLRTEFATGERKLPRRWTPWLVIPYRHDDLGARPTPPGDPFWASPYIWLETASGVGPQAVAGEPAYVHARVFNLGSADAIPVRVDFYWGDPSMGLAAHNMHHIGTEYVEIPAHRSLDVRCSTPWVPQFLNGGHECLVVHCTHPFLDPLQVPFDPTQDRHVGQRNITIRAAPPGGRFRFVLNTNRMTADGKLRIRGRAHRLHIPPGTLGPEAGREPFWAVLAATLPATNTKEELATRFPMRTAAWDVAMDVAHATRHTVAKLEAAVPMHDTVAGAPGPIQARFLEDRRIQPHAAGHGAPCVEAPVARPATTDRGLLLAQEESAEGDIAQQRAVEIECDVPADAVPGEMIVYHFVQEERGVEVGGHMLVLQVEGAGSVGTHKMWWDAAGTDPSVHQSNQGPIPIEAGTVDDRVHEHKTTEREHMTTKQHDHKELERLVIEEIDGASETYEVARQLVDLIPIESFADIRKAGKDGLTFRGKVYDVTAFEPYIPATIFPICDARTLVAHTGQFVRRALEALPATPGDVDSMRRQLGQAMRAGQPPTGMPLGQRPFESAMPGDRKHHDRKGGC